MSEPCACVLCAPQYKNSHLMAAVTAGGGSLQVSLVDTVAGKVLHRVSHANAEVLDAALRTPGAGASGGSGESAGSSVTGGSGGCVVLSENWVVYGYWNAKAKRTELGVLALFEGIVGPYALNPFKVSLQGCSRDKNPHLRTA